MTEMENLKAEADRQYAKQRMQRLIEYMDELYEALAEGRKAVLKGLLGFTAGWAVWIVTDIAFPLEGIGPGIMAYVVGIFYMHYQDRKHARARAELRGCIKTLRLLGYLDELPEGRKRRRKRIRDSALAGLRAAWDAARAKGRAVWRPGHA